MFYASELLRDIAQEVIDENENLSHLKGILPGIAFQYSTEAKKNGKKVIYADTEKVKDKYKALLPYYFIITFYEPNVSELDDELLHVLMYHELRHVGWDGERCSIIPHDIEDFKDIIDKFGTSWIGV